MLPLANPGRMSAGGALPRTSSGGPASDSAMARRPAAVAGRRPRHSSSPGADSCRQENRAVVGETPLRDESWEELT